MFLLTTSSMWSCGRRQLLQLRIVWEFLLTNTPTNFSTSQSISLQHSYHSDTVLYIEKKKYLHCQQKISFFFHRGWGHKILFCARKTCTLRPGIFTRTIGKIIATNAENQFWGNILQSIARWYLSHNNNSNQFLWKTFFILQYICQYICWVLSMYPNSSMYPNLDAIFSR